ncbi:MAG: hypothetical protein IPL53_13935 [Ignavibacteria bacterium]|nr:hypothetical protein [Ignavibacteria bacterium]
MSTLNPLQYTRVLILMKDRVDIEQLDKDLYEMNATMGYIASDLTGNRIVDLTDLLLVFNNASNFVSQESLPDQVPFLLYMTAGHYMNRE